MVRLPFRILVVDIIVEFVVPATIVVIVTVYKRL
jgi:hypothetical protein